MAVSVTRLPGELIVIATLSGPLNVEAMRNLYAQTAEAAKDIDGPFFQIGDFLHADVSFREIARMMRDIVRKQPYSMSDPRLRPVLVSPRNRLRVLPELMRQKEFGRIEMPVFDTLDEAVSYSRSKMALPIPA